MLTFKTKKYDSATIGSSGYAILDHVVCTFCSIVNYGSISTKDCISVIGGNKGNQGNAISLCGSVGAVVTNLIVLYVDTSA